MSQTSLNIREHTYLGNSLHLQRNNHLSLIAKGHQIQKMLDPN